MRPFGTIRHLRNLFQQKRWKKMKQKKSDFFLTQATNLEALNMYYELMGQEEEPDQMFYAS